MQRMTARFDESYAKTQLSLRSMKWQLSAFVEIEGNLSLGPQSPASIISSEIYRKLKHITGYQSLGKL